MHDISVNAGPWGRRMEEMAALEVTSTSANCAPVVNGVPGSCSKQQDQLAVLAVLAVAVAAVL